MCEDQKWVEIFFPSNSPFTSLVGVEVFSSAVDNYVPANVPVWQRPSSSRYKCNIDIAFSFRFNRTGISIYVRDFEGIFVLAKVVSYPCCYSIDVEEVMGSHSALQFDNVDFETDFKLTCDAFHTTRDDYSEFGCIIFSCRTLVNFSLPTLGWSLLSDKPMRLFMFLQEKSHYQLVPTTNTTGVHSSVVEHLTADQEVTGSNPFGSSSGFAKSRRSFMHLIWFASSWVIWKKRNQRLFRGIESSPIQLLENVKLISF
ncbi:hypothetical protein MTR_1g018300 [Medicago truncatula]|uniref:Uncharacterized protein n=1 Tax=Medicago truncatula TaxID=3880 RepID=G7ICD5_MEDTR|nr:hypothetical protein MTR_1g018300 [Medicago truncatula]